jgi:hypothetical protein
MLRCYCPHTNQFYPQPFQGYYGYEAYPNALGEETTTTRVRNDTDETVEVYWVAIGWHCATEIKGGYPFVCHSKRLRPGEEATYSAKGYLRGVGVATNGRFCGSDDLQAGSTSLRVGRIIDKGTCFPNVGGWLCELVGLAKKIPIFGSVIDSVLRAVGFRC